MEREELDERSLSTSELISHITERTRALVQEQIALAKTGNLVEAAAGLEELISRVGPSSDRCGIRGGPGRPPRLRARHAGPAPGPRARRPYAA